MKKKLQLKWLAICIEALWALIKPMKKLQKSAQKMEKRYIQISGI